MYKLVIQKILTIMLLGILGCIPANSFGQYSNRIHPPHLFDYEFQVFDSTNHDYFLFTPYHSVALSLREFKPFPLILDDQGYVLWYGTDVRPSNYSDFKYLPAADNYVYMAFFDSIGARGIILDEQMQSIDTIAPNASATMDIHDILIRSDGISVWIAVVDSLFDLSADTINGQLGDANTHCRCFDLREMDQQGQILWHWNSCAHLHPRLGYTAYGYNVNDFNYAHLNSIDTDLQGNYLLSFRHLNAVVKVNRQSGNVDWILGGKANQFSFTNTTPFTAQHYARQLPNGNISIFDNAFISANTESRALQFQLDTINMTATSVFEYTSSLGVNSAAMGNYQVTDSVQLINYGYLFRPAPSLELIGGDKQVQKRIFFKDGVMSYRGVLFQPRNPFPRPEIHCSEEFGTFYLDAPSGFSNYLWSNGDTTQRIIAQASTEYQVWVNYGTGMLGSLPYLTHDSLVCQPVSADPFLNNSKPKTKPVLLGTYDLLGRRVEAKTSNQVLIERYSDGSSRRVLHIME